MAEDKKFRLMDRKSKEWQNMDWKKRWEIINAEDEAKKEASEKAKEAKVRKKPLSPNATNLWKLDKKDYPSSINPKEVSKYSMEESIIIECTHMWDGRPVALQTRYMYGLDASTIEVYDPIQGNYVIVPVKDLQPIKVQKVKTAKSKVAAAKKAGPKKAEKKGEKKMADKKDDKKADEKKAKEEKDAKIKKEKEAKEKKEKKEKEDKEAKEKKEKEAKKKKLKEDIVQKLNKFLGEEEDD